MGAIFRNNWRAELTEHQSCQRVYALDDEAGLLLCTWPRGGRPALPFPYADEVWTGTEYQVAAHMIYNGLVDEGLTIVLGLRARFDGERRNPWNEYECGHHYARALSSWSLLLALSGFRTSAPDAHIAFAPAINAANFRCFFSTGSGWGSFAQQTGSDSLTASLDVRHGSLQLRSLGLRLPGVATGVWAKRSGAEVVAYLEDRAGARVVVFDPAITLATGQTLVVSLACPPPTIQNSGS